MRFKISKEPIHKSLVYGKAVFFDTNCYRALAKRIRKEGVYHTNSWIKELRKQEKKIKITSQLSYLVVTELFTHLGDPVTSDTYEECKLALQLAITHINHDTKKVLSDYDNQIIKFIHGQISKLRESTEKSLLDLVIHLSHNQFTDKHIKSKLPAFKGAKKYLDNIKQNWKEAFSENLIDKYQDEKSKSTSQIFVNDLEKRNQRLKKFEEGEKNGRVFDFFAAGMLMYCNNSLVPMNQIEPSKELFERIKNRFLPLFMLQLRIIKLICQSGYNLDKNENDFIDWMILSALDPSQELLFISNETKKLIPFLKESGFDSNILSFEQYLSAIDFNKMRSNNGLW